MFLRTHTLRRDGKEYAYLKVVENTWRQGKTAQRTLVNFGNLASWPEGKLAQMVQLLEGFLQTDMVALEQVRIDGCRELGPYLALAALWDQVGLDEILAAVPGIRGRPEYLLPCTKAMVLSRLVEPTSKRALREVVAETTQIPGVAGESLELQHYYRSLNHLARAQRPIEKALHGRIKHLFNQDLSLVFYDVTSAYFEGSKCRLARHGYSREHRPDLLQIEIGLLVDADGIPIGHEVFDGNIKDVTTVLGVLERLQRDFAIQRCIFVGDDGMASAPNLAAVEQAGYEYITSLSLGKSKRGQELLQQAPPLRRWRKLADNFWLHPLGQDGRVRYVGSYNPDRAASTREHRQRHLRECIAELERLAAPPKPRSKARTMDETWAAADRFLRHKHCRSFFTLTPGDSQQRLHWRLERTALRQERSKDGLLILVTNAKTISDEEVAQGYRSLWRVENAFRQMKDEIRLRPIRHWSDPRVLGHVFVCVLAYALEQLLEQRLHQAGIAMSAAAALDTLRPIKVVTLDAGSRIVRRRSEITPQQRHILGAVGVQEVPEIW